MFPEIKYDFSEGFITMWGNALCLSENKGKEECDYLIYIKSIKKIQKYANQKEMLMFANDEDMFIFYHFLYFLFPVISTFYTYNEKTWYFCHKIKLYKL